MQNPLDLAEIGVRHLGQLGHPPQRQVGHLALHADVVPELLLLGLVAGHAVPSPRRGVWVPVSRVCRMPATSTRRSGGPRASWAVTSLARRCAAGWASGSTSRA